MPKESRKNRDWEKERRNRLNVAFTSLHKLLPIYDPASNSSKIEILTKAITYIEELQGKLKDLLEQDNKEESVKKVASDQFTKLQERVKHLIKKNEQLCVLLQKAKIRIPKGYSLKKLKNPRDWSQKITPEQAEIIQEKEAGKENDTSVKKAPKKCANKKQKSQGTPKHRKTIHNRPKRTSKKNKPLPPKCVLVISQPASVTQPCYVITNAPSNNILGGASSTIITNSGILNPLVSAKPTKTIPSLGPGTLILANGTILPVAPPTIPLLPQIIRPPPIIVVSKNSSSTTSTTKTTKTLTRIKPKYCFTKTTQVNKVPIPALTSRYSNSEVLKKAKPEKKPDKSEKRKAPPSDEVPEPKKAQVVEKEPPKEPEKKPEEKKSDKEVEPTTKKTDENVELSELSNDIFASLQVPSGCQNPESTSPTAAFLLAFPLVSSLTGVKVTEVPEEDSGSQRETPTLLQIGTMENTKPTETLTPSLLNLDNLSFFSSKDITGFYNFDNVSTASVTVGTDKVVESEAQPKKLEPKQHKPELKAQPAHQPILKQQPAQPVQKQPPIHSQKPQQTQSIQQKSQQSIQQPHTSMQSMQHSKPNMQHNQPTIQQSQSIPQTLQTQPMQQSQSIQKPQTLQTQPMQQSQSIQQSQPVQQNQNLQQTQSLQHSKPIQQPQSMQQAQPMQQPQSMQHSQSIQQQSQPHSQSLQQSQPIQQSQTMQQSQPIQQSQSIQQQPPSVQPMQHQPIQQSLQRSIHQPQHSIQPIQQPHQSIQQQSHQSLQQPQKSLKQPIQQHQQIQSRQQQENVPCFDNSLSFNYQKNNYSYNFNETPKTTTFSYGTIRSYPEPLYTNSSTYGYSNTTANNQNYYKDITKNENRYYSLNYENYADYRKNDSANNYFSSNYYNYNKTNQVQKNKTINWMTAPDLPQFTKEDFYSTNTSFSNTQTPYFNSNPVYSSDTTAQKIDLGLVPPVNTYQRNDVEDNQFAWSPTKIPQFLDPPSFVSSTLPTLVGDLALGNSLFTEKEKKKDGRRKGYENQSFLSVSQLVDHNKEAPARTTARRNSGGRSSAKKVQQKSGQRKENCEKSRKNNYSAEALIQDTKRQKPMAVPSFLHENIIPYFPTVDLQQDNSYMQQNQPFGGNLIPEVPHDYPELFSKEKSVSRQQCPPATPKKPKRKHSNDLPGFVDFPFLSMNSPILPDDFHTHTTFPQLYPCKTSTALLPLPPPVTRSHIPEISPINSGTSLTNFNLSTIFPEINKAEPYAKEGRSYAPVQVSFNEKPSLSFSYSTSQYSQ